MICSITQPGISYVYDYAGNTDNIVKETRTSGSYAGETTYAYDTLGQLTRVNDPVENATWVYTYDRGGNILNKKRYAYTTGTVGTVQQTITYTYDGTWKDKLATYNGITLTHDAGGNLTNDGTWTYSWQAGRELLKMEKTGTKIVYDYDHNGMRVRKTAAGVATDYTVSGRQVTHLVKGSDWMHFFYDGQGKPSIVNYKGATYHYLYNLQGDVIGLVDTSGNVVVEYKYDAWGKIIARTGSLASTLGYLNPFRYRGYVYDEETGLYYLRSRYYNPEWGRFINVDVQLGETSGILTHNVFAYCRNVPVCSLDADGYVRQDCHRDDGVDTHIPDGMWGGGGGYSVDLSVAASSSLWHGGIINCGYSESFSPSLSTYIRENITTTKAATSTSGKTYYHATSSHAAKAIQESGVLKPSSVEGCVFVLKNQPTRGQARQVGSMSAQTVIRFTTTCASFVPDTTTHVPGAMRNSIDGPIKVTNVQKVGFKRWWK